MSDRLPQGYKIVVDDSNPFVIYNASPNYSSVSPPHPDDLLRPLNRLRTETWYLVGRGRIVGLVETWAQGSEATRGIPNATAVSYRGWEAAVEAYTSAFNANALFIEPTITPSSNVATGSYTQPYIVNSNASTPARGAAHRPISVRSSPAPQAPPANTSTPAGVGSRYPVSGFTGPISPPSACQPVGWVGCVHNPLMVSASPTPSANQPNTPIRSTSTSTRQTPAHRANTPDASAARLRTIAEVLDSNSSRNQTPAPIAPHGAADPDSLAVRLRAVELALNHYTSRSGISPPSPTTPTTADSALEARVSALEQHVDDLLTREAERLSAEQERRALRHAVLSRAFDECRTRMLADGIITATHVPSRGRSDGRDPTPLATSIAGSSTGPGTAACATTPSNRDLGYFSAFGTDSEADEATLDNNVATPGPFEDEDIDYFSGYEDFSVAEEAALNDLLDDIDSAYQLEDDDTT